MKKTFINMMLIFSILIISSTATANAQTFSDLSPDHPSYNTVMNLVAAGIVDGYPDGTVKPDQYIVRAELMKIIVEGMSLYPHPLDYNRCFEDVQILSDWYIGYVCYAETEGWIVGYPDGTFGPENNINNVEILSMIFNSYGLQMPGQWDYDARPFTDVPEDEWYFKYVWFAKENGIIDSDSDTYNPGEIVTRAQAFEILEKTLAYINGLSVPTTSTIDNIAFTHPKSYQLESTDDLGMDFVVYMNEDEDGIGFVPESVFEEFMTEFDMDWEMLFEGMEGQIVDIKVKEGKVEKLTEYYEYVDDDPYYGDTEGMFIFKISPESGSGEIYYVVAHYIYETTRSEILEMIKTIEIK
ncbi:S-layer homology domain-containing protein [Patescibacteria group bacterium]